MINPVTSAARAPAASAASDSTQPRQWGFAETLRGVMNQAQQLQGGAENTVSALLHGDGMDVHSAMIAVEKADLSFQLMMQVRNKIVAAYQEISRMQF
jgi:flagellar hook-basal body complex protein FliE